MKKIRLMLLIVLALLICILPVSAEENVIFFDEFLTDTRSEYVSNGPSLDWNESDKTLSITGNGWKSVDKLLAEDSMDSGKIVIEYSVRSSTSNKPVNFGVIINNSTIYSSDIKNMGGSTLYAVIDKDNATYTVYDQNENIKSSAVTIPVGTPIQGFCLNTGTGSVITLNHIKVYFVERHTEDIFFLDDFLTNTTSQYVSHGPSLVWNQNDKSLTVTGNGWKAVDKIITSDESFSGKVVLEFSVKTSTSNKAFNFGVMVNDAIVYSSDIKNLTGTTLYAVIDKDKGTYIVYDENENIKSAAVSISAGYPLQGFCLNMGSGSTVTFDYIKAYYINDSQRKDLYFDDLSNASASANIQPQKAQHTVEDGVAKLFAKTLANPRITMPNFPADTNSLVFGFKVKKIFGGTAKLYLVEGNSQTLLLEMPSCYEWTMFDLMFDFTDNTVRVYKDGIIYDTVEFTYTNKSDLYPYIIHSINGQGIEYDYFRAYQPTTPKFQITEKTVTKVVLSSDNPISDSEINSITVENAQIKSIKRRNLDEIIITFATPLVDSVKYIINTNNVKDIFGNSFDAKINLSFSDKISVNHLESSVGSGVATVTGEITNDNFTSKQVELVLCAYSDEKLVSMKTRKLRLQPGNNDITETFETDANVTVKCFVWSSFDNMIMID